MSPSPSLPLLQSFVHTENKKKDCDDECTARKARQDSVGRTEDAFSFGTCLICAARCLDPEPEHGTLSISPYDAKSQEPRAKAKAKRMVDGRRRVLASRDTPSTVPTIPSRRPLPCSARRIAPHREAAVSPFRSVLLLLPPRFSSTAAVFSRQIDRQSPQSLPSSPLSHSPVFCPVCALHQLAAAGFVICDFIHTPLLHPSSTGPDSLQPRHPASSSPSTS
ncbi:hypothetical protein F4823DRAFT_562756 [Ustulina deusta]|nr:hypothetical protein F4823DRAFT_562756 [Ustulina deusta]